MRSIQCSGMRTATHLRPRIELCCRPNPNVPIRQSNPETFSQFFATAFPWPPAPWLAVALIATAKPLAESLEGLAGGKSSAADLDRFEHHPSTTRRGPLANRLVAQLSTSSAGDALTDLVQRNQRLAINVDHDAQEDTATIPVSSTNRIKSLDFLRSTTKILVANVQFRFPKFAPRRKPLRVGHSLRSCALAPALQGRFHGRLTP